MPKFLKYSVIFFAFIIIILLMAPFFIPLDSYKDLASKKVQEITGRELKINGPISLSFLPTPTVKVKDIELSSIPDAKYDSLLIAKKVSASISILSLLKGNIELSSISIDDPVINLERTKTGAASWDFPQKNPNSSSADQASNQTDNDKVKNELSIGLIKIVNGKLNYLDAINTENSPMTILIDNLEIRKFHGPDNISAEIYSSGTNYNIKGNIHEKQGVIAIKTNLEIFKEKIMVSGDLARDKMNFIGKLNVEGNAKNLQEILPNVKILNNSDHTITCDINGDKNLFTFNNINFTSGKIIGSGKGNFLLENGKVDLQMKLNPGDIDLNVSPVTGNNDFNFSQKLMVKANALKPLLEELAVDLKSIPVSLLNQAFILTTDLLYKDQNLALNNMKLNINKATLSGNLGVKNWNNNILVNYNVHVDQPRSFANLFDIQLPGNINNLSLRGQLNKEGEGIKTNSNLTFAEASTNIQGFIGLGKTLKPNLIVESTGKNLDKVIGQLSSSSANNGLGNYSLSAKIVGDTQEALQIDLSKFNVNFKNSPVNLSGGINVKLATSKPKITSDIKIGTIKFSNLASRGASSSNARASVTSTTAGSAWSNDKIDLAFLKKFDGDINLNIQQIIKDDLVFDTVQMLISLLNGNLNIKSLSGKVFGGTLEANGQISSDGPVSLKANLQGANLRNIVKQKGKIKIVSGIIDYTMDIKTTGQSQMQYMRNLAGNATLKGRGGALAGFDLQRLLNVIKNIKNPAKILQVFEQSFSGGDTQFENLVFSTNIKNGIASITEGKLQAGLIMLSAAGNINLPNYSCEINTTIALDDKKSYPPFTVRFYGSLNNIQHKIALEDLQQYLIKKVIGGIIKGQKPKDIINSIIGGKSPETSEGKGKDDEVKDLIGKGVKGLLNKLSK